MGSPFFGMDIAVSGLFASQIQLNTTSHNIANSETEGYTKQSVTLEAAEALRTRSKIGMVGTGVLAEDIAQTRNSYYDIKYRRSNGIAGEYEAKSYYLTEIENYLNELDESGFTTLHDNFYEALSDLSNDPMDLDKRQAVSQEAETLMDYFNTLYGNLQTVQTDLNSEVKVQVDEINSIAKEIAELNVQISLYELNGGTANDLRDQRNKILDDLSGICHVETQELTINEDGLNKGTKIFRVTINGEVLVDNNIVNELKCEIRPSKENQNDVDGLYDVVWAKTGEKLHLEGVEVSGRLKALIDVRDGNNDENLQGRVTANVGDTLLTITGTNINGVSKMNMPEQGRIVIGGAEYYYDGFTAKEDYNGQFFYDFNLTTPVRYAVTDKIASVGDCVDCKGVPYFQSMINEFMRTFTSEFNEIHRGGDDLNGNAGLDFFVYTDAVTENQVPEIPAIDEKQSFTVFKTINASYYKMTGHNIKVNEKILDDPSLIAAADKDSIEDGGENKENIVKLIALKNDVNMFKQGTPSSYLQTIVSEIGVVNNNASSLSENQSNIVTSIEKMRLSTSGVDVDEEGMDLIKYQRAYELSSKVFNIMNEIYRKLINETGV
ncbi:MAG: flagellar hook-associated protein FlgK [Lachnospiraceae bacterium]|nr:flagellar hook-associated protein FlgK [Lachnospiraceae bacterium]